MQKRTWHVPFLSPLTLALMVASCGDQEPPPEMEAEIEQLRAERETLGAELEEAHREIGSLREAITQIELPDAFLTQLETSPRTAADSVRAITARAEQATQALQGAESRASAFQQRVDSLRTVHEQAMEDHESRLDEADQRRQALEDEAARLSAANQELEGEVERLSSFVRELETELGAAHYVVGTRDELLERGIVTEEGGARFLGFLWKRGETLVPARGTDPSQFTRIDREQELEIQLPTADATYRIVSRHDPRHLGPDVAESGRLRGERLEILDPEAFWQTSSFLIILEEGS